MDQHKCCGGIIFNINSQKYLLIQLKNGSHWDFPKGHMEEGETEEETALREIFEEVGLKVNLQQGFREIISYADGINNVHKTVVFFLAKTSSFNITLQDEEVGDYLWLEFNDALEKLTYENAKNLLQKAENFFGLER